MIDNIFINKFKNENYSVYSLINGLPDHDVQVLSISDITVPNDGNELYSYRGISIHSINTSYGHHSARPPAREPSTYEIHETPDLNTSGYKG